jgi:IS5 family transposase
LLRREYFRCFNHFPTVEGERLPVRRAIPRKLIDFTLLCRAFKSITPETWQTVNRLYAIRMKHEGKIDIDHLRTDTTVTETNIHYPTDSSLLWDVYRTLYRLITQARELGFRVPAMRFHKDDVKKLHLNVTRHSNSKKAKTQRKVKQWMKDLIDRVDWAVAKAFDVQVDLLASPSEAVQKIGQVLDGFLPTMVQIVEVALSRWKGETVPNGERLLKGGNSTLFLPHFS